MKKWVIVYGDYEQDKKAVSLINSKVCEQINFPTHCEKADIVDKQTLKDNNIILIGSSSNALISTLIDENKLEKCNKPQQYYIYVNDSFWNKDNSVIVISGYDKAGITYGAVDFINLYLGDKVHDKNGYNIVDDRFYKTAFLQKTPAFSRLSAPSISERGIWCWAHCVYDYKKFFDNMLMLKLNVAVLWTDYAPINAKEVVSYAHECGIKLIWGYSWGWEVDSAVLTDFSSPAQLEIWSEKIIKKYEDEFLNTGCDGIYFQTFTERNDNTVNGKCVAETVTTWVNGIFAKMKAKYPNIRVQFGLHATSVKEDTEFIKNVDPDMEIIWEDCGSFPYRYYHTTHDFADTLNFTSKICTLRSPYDKFGAVLKGMTTLNWAIFEHQTGPYVMGEHSQLYVEKRGEEKRKLWRLFQTEWLNKKHFFLDTVKQILKTRDGNISLQLLVEDGLLEYKVWLPVAFACEMLWQTDITEEELVERVLQFPCVHLA
ncbi:MAG: hypothetical protein E7353_05710 [Clostridiales bacterium]|nr:hypothetical protein [Clostridiales bacterium]